METLQAYKLVKEQLKQRKDFKQVCDGCVPNEYIELDTFILAILEELTKHCIETLEDLKSVLNKL